MLIFYKHALNTPRKQASLRKLYTRVISIENKNEKVQINQPLYLHRNPPWSCPKSVGRKEKIQVTEMKTVLQTNKNVKVA